MWLAIDTATKVTSVAVGAGVDTIACRADGIANPGEVLAPLASATVTAAHVGVGDIDQVFVGVGPGPYTSTRVGVAFANAVALASRISVAGLCTQDAIAAQFDAPDLVVATDARRKEIYWARYVNGRRIAGPTVGSPAAVVDRFADSVWVGDGLERYPDLAGKLDWRPAAPTAALVGMICAQRVAAGVAAVQPPSLVTHGQHFDDAALADIQLFPPVPLYLRRPDAAAPRSA